MKLSLKQIINLTWSALASLYSPGKSKYKLPKTESKIYPEIYVFRHGETFDNKNRVFSGHRDSKLTPNGIKQAKALTDKLKNKDIDLCFTSSLSRSIETAKIALKGKSVVYEVDDRIIERDYGRLTGMSKLKLTKQNLEKAVEYRRFYDVNPPGGESLKDVKKRVFPFCRDIVRIARENNQNIAVSCHGNSMKIIRMFFEKITPYDTLLQENPLGSDYSQYIVTSDNIIVGRSRRKKEA